ncbi:MAG: FG-GAP-like repeat-containing protein [Candidatus Neomarinimicrobiota bacterium]
MKKMLSLMLVFAAFGFAAQANLEGDVLFATPYKVNAMAAVAAGIEGFDVGVKGSTEIIRDLWVGSDFDQDGNKEVMLASYGDAGEGRVYVYEIDGDNNATLFFDTGPMGGTYGHSCRHVAYGDLDGNGMQELLVSINSANDAVGGLWAFEYDTVGDSMRAPVQLFKDIVTADRWYVENFTVADADNDGVEEVIWGNNAAASALDNFYIASVESGTFAENNIVTKIEFVHGKASATFPVGGSPYGGVVADLNGDGMNEILFAPWDHGAMLIVENNSPDNYTAVNYIQTDLDRNDDFAFWDFHVKDLDGDGRDEAYLSMYSGGRLYAITCPVGTELADMTTANVHTLDDLGSSGGVATVIGDLDGNGRMNIYASGGGSYLTNHEFIGTDPTDSTHWMKLDNITSPSLSGVYGVRYAGDLDGDGYDEIYCANTGATTIAAVAIENVPADAPAVFFSEYIEGGGNNKALEIYNGTSATIELNDYRIAQTNNGSDWKNWHTFPVDATLAAGEVWVIITDQTSTALFDPLDADEVLGYPSVVHHNGDDARAIEYSPAGDSLWYKIDVIGFPNFDPGKAWDVAGITNATQDHTLVRKESVVKGNLNWAESAGTTVENSEWEVYDKDTFEYLGEHPTVPVLEDPADFFIPKGAHAQGYVSLKAAVDHINANGVTGEINFILDADTLREESFTFAADLDADNNVTVKPAEGRDVVLIVAPGASQGNGPQMIGFDKGYVTFDGSNNETDSQNLIITTEGAVDLPIGINAAGVHGVVIKNLIIKNLDGATTTFKYGVASNDVGGNSFVVDNCQIGTPEMPVWRDGVAVWGDWTNMWSVATVTNNDIHAGARGISTYIAGDCIYANNNVTLYPVATTYSYNYGIYLSYVNGAEVYGNVIRSAEATPSGSDVSKVGGIVTASQPEGTIANIYNNIVITADPAETVPAYGFLHMSSNDARTFNVYHNTIVVQGAGETHAIGNSSTGPITMDLKNNIIINNNVGNPASTAIKLVSAETVLDEANNVIVAAEKFANLGGTDYADLAAWQAAGHGVGSIAKNVTFASATDLHLAAPSDEDTELAMPAIASVPTDIDGDDRGAFFAYAGADEGTVYPSNDLNLTFDDDSDVANWGVYDEASGWTSVAWEAGALKLTDAGWSALSKRPVKATVGAAYKLTVDIKTENCDGKGFELSVQGLGNDAGIATHSDSGWVTYTILGVAEAGDGYIRIGSSSGSGSAVTILIDNLVWDDQYLDAKATADLATARAIPDGEFVAVKGIVNNNRTGAPVFIEDATAGMSLYEWDLINDGIVEEGDEILVVGKRASYRGLIQVSNIGSDYQVLSKDNPVVPTLITVPDLDSRDYQGMLVMIEEVDTVEGFSWPAEGNDASITLVDKDANEFTLRIDRDSEIDGAPAPDAWPINLVGVVSEFNDPQIMPRSIDDFITNQAPGAFTWLNPVDGAVISTLEDSALVDDGDGKSLLMNWTAAVDPEGDTVTYKLGFIGEGPDEDIVTTDTSFLQPINIDAPYEMNGTYMVFITASDPEGKETISDTITITFDFAAPPMVVNADVVLVDGTPKYYVEFDMPVAAEAANFKVANLTAASLDAATAVSVVTPCAVMVTAPLPEDNLVSLLVDGVTAPAGDLSIADTTAPQVVYIPFSDAHPEDAAGLIEGFEGTFNYFDKALTHSGSTTGILAGSSFLASEEAVYQGSKSAKMTILDDPAIDGGWFVRHYVKYPYSKTVKANSVLFLMVKGSGDVDLALTIKDSGYERQLWKSVSLAEDDWQVLSFDISNDPVEPWITGDGVVTGETVTVCDLHVKSSADEDVVLYLDGFTERQVLEPVDITLNVNMKEWHRQGKFNLATHFVDVAGTMNGWGSESMVLNDFDNDTTYSITIPLMPFSHQLFKFRINGSWGDDTAEFPSGGPNRELTVPMAAAEYTYWYNNDTLIVVGTEDMIPVEFALHQNYPNPFNPTTMIEFDLPEVSDVSLVIYDITGRQVRTLINESAVQAGYKGVTWNGRDNMGNGVATGMYIYRLQAGDNVDVKKMTFMK